MRSRRLPGLTFVVIFGAALAAVACGGGGGSTTATSTRPAASSTAGTTTSPTPEAQASPTVAPTEEATPAVSTETVEISAIPTIKFDKDTITVTAGSQVTLKFTNTDTGVPHSWSAYTDSTATTPIPGAKVDVCTGPCEEQVTFTAPSQPGDYFFHCDVHPSIMKGTLIVR